MCNLNCCTSCFEKERNVLENVKCVAGKQRVVSTTTAHFYNTNTKARLETRVRGDQLQKREEPILTLLTATAIIIVIFSAITITVDGHRHWNKARRTTEPATPTDNRSFTLLHAYEWRHDIVVVGLRSFESSPTFRSISCSNSCRFASNAQFEMSLNYCGGSVWFKFQPFTIINLT